MADGTTRRGGAGRTRAAALLAATMLALGGQTVHGQQSAPPAGSEAAPSFSIPPGPLGPALTQFGRTAGIEFVAPGALLDGRRTGGLAGTFPVGEALDRLLAGSGLVYARDGDTIRLSDPAAGAGDGVLTLDPVRIAGTAEQATGPVDGYVAARTATGTKTDTPITRVPQSLTVIPRERLEDQNVESVEEALRYTAGVLAEPFGRDVRYDQFSLRSFGATTGGTFRDGLQAGASGLHVGRYEPYGLERVEVLRGPSSVLFGDGSPGGIVNLVSKRPPDSPLAEVKAEYGSFDFKQAAFDVGAPVVDSPALSFRLTGLARDADTEVDFSRNDRLFLAPALRVEPTEDTRITLLASFYEDSQFSFGTLPAQGTLEPNPNGTISRDLFVGDPDFDTVFRREAAIGYDAEHRFSETFRVQQLLRYSDLDTDWEVLFGAGLRDDLRTLDRAVFTAEGGRTAFAVDTQGHLSFAAGPTEHEVLVGVDYQRLFVENTQGYSDSTFDPGVPTLDLFDPVYGVFDIAEPPIFLENEITQNQVGLYLQDQISLNRAFLTVGLRHDFVDQETEDLLANTTESFDDQETSFRAGLGYAFDIGVTPYASYTESFEPVAETDADGDPFEPTTGRQYEVGVKYAPPDRDLLLTAAAFHLTEDNILSPDPDDPVNSLQGGTIRAIGVELEGQADIGDAFRLYGSYTYTDAEVTEETDQFEEGAEPLVTPSHVASVFGVYSVPGGVLSGLEVGGGVRFVSESQGDAANTITNPGFTVFDASLGYEWRGLKARVTATNLFDNDYVICNGGDTACNFGAPLTVKASLAYRW